MNENLKIKGQLRYTLVNDKQEVVEVVEGPNLVVNGGTAFLASLLAGTGPTLMTHMAVGTSGVAPISSNTALGAEIGRVALTSTVASVNSTVYTATFPPGVGTGTIAEAGLFNAGVAGLMLSRSTSISVTKGAGDTLNVVWTISFVA